MPDSVHWEAALEHYQCDRLEAAYAEISEWGIGEAGSYLPWYRVIEAELITRQKSERLQVEPWLGFEFVPGEVLDSGALATRIFAACEQVAEHFGWSHSEPTLVSVLAEEADAPWATHPYGYCAHKEPYEKICLPGYLVDDLEEFSQAVAHEYAHVVSESLADGNAMRWLEEAISVFVEMRLDEDTRQKLSNGRAPWWTPSQLEVVLAGKYGEDDVGAESDHADEVWVAYQQAGWIGRYLDAIGGGRKVATMLRKIADETPAWNLRRTLRGHGRVEGALKEIYGLSTDELFAKARAYMVAERG